jgi:hypothetical protein
MLTLGEQSWVPVPLAIVLPVEWCLEQDGAFLSWGKSHLGYRSVWQSSVFIGSTDCLCSETQDSKVVMWLEVREAKEDSLKT